MSARSGASLVLDHGERLGERALGSRVEPPCQRLQRLLDVARYWLAFELARFEPLLVLAPPPLRELGVGVLLRFGESPDGLLQEPDLAAAERGFDDLPADVAPPFRQALDIFARALRARSEVAARERQGYRPARSPAGVPAVALRSSGAARIEVEGFPSGTASVSLPTGSTLRVMARDDRGRALAPPEVESSHGAPAWLGEPWEGGRDVFLPIPGVYVLRIPGRADGARTIVAR